MTPPGTDIASIEGYAHITSTNGRPTLLNDIRLDDLPGALTPRPKPVIISRADHPISRAAISGAALKVLYRLKEAGFQSFLVGGSVRDLLLGLTPKDFDVATNARPEDVRRLFRNCRLIGRRFRLAHVIYGDEIIEVATFRAAQAPAETDDEDAREVEEPSSSDHRVSDDSGRILRDNLYGTIDEDVWRRDFGANALYYNIADFSIWDYVGGVADVMRRELRLIGDPQTRYREDPVRLLRAARFAAKLGFTLHPDTLKPIASVAPSLAGVPAARLFDESLKLFLGGHAAASWKSLTEFGLIEQLFPAVAEELSIDPDGPARQLIDLGLANTDARVAMGKSVTPTFLFAVLLYGPIVRLAEERIEQGAPELDALADAFDRVVSEQIRRVAVPKRFTLPLRELYGMQHRFEQHGGRRSVMLLDNPRFRAAYDFFLLRAQAGGADPEVAQWWTEIQELPPEERLAKALAVAPAGEAGAEPGKRRRRRRRRGGGGNRGGAPPETAGPG